MVRFGEFELDEGRRQLLRNGEPLPLPAKHFLLLQLLIERRPNAIPKRELYDRLWPSTFVSPDNLPSLIAELRTTLGDDAHHPRFIRTVHGFGYAFCGEIEAAPRDADPPCVAVLIGDHIDLRLGEGETIIGRDRSLRCAVDDPSVSRHHAAVSCADGSCSIRDLGSKNGTFVGGVRVTVPRALCDGDTITLGNVRLAFRRAAAESTITVRPGES
jgi:DNA-binding winged helix-turn-helix (wHTH) protein